MSESNGQLPHTCGNCRHWFRGKPTPQNLTPPGECRQGPPHATVIPVTGPMGQQGMMTQSTYPSLPPNFPACGQYSAKVALMMEGATR